MDKKPKKGFLYWFENVFKYHYGKLAIIIVLAVIVVVINIIDASRPKLEFDFNMVIAVAGPIAPSSTNELLKIAEKEAGDLNGDGEININIQIIDMGIAGEDSSYRLMLLKSQPEYVVYIMDEHTSETNARDFNMLSEYGIEADEEYGQRVYIGDTAVMDSISPGTEFYALLADWTTDGKGDPLWTQAGVSIIKAIIGS